MPVTLAQAALNTQTDLDFAVIDNLRRYGWLLDQIAWDNTVTPGTGGSTLTYGYTRLLAARTAGFRAINSEYVPAEATRERKTVDLKPMGGSFQVDRTLAKLGPAATNEVSFQIQQLLAATRNKFQQELINGDTAVDANGWDGLDKILTGQSTEYLPASNGVAPGYLDWTAGAINTQPLAMAALDRLDDWLSRIVPSTTGGGDQGEPGALPPGVKAIVGNTTSITRVRALARWAGMYTATKDDIGREVEMYGQWFLVDAGDTATGAGPIVPIETRDADGAGAGGNITGLTDLYAVSFGLDALHGAAVAGQDLVQTFMPDFNLPGAVKLGEVEMGPCALVVKNTRSCGVLRNVKVSG
ncbi:major capsid protein [Streptomyces sp. URMC 129]|uniref:major capsid protein n=1 Tax=Streptomyces sp. URMC 129 TaxID=3423407 RepID=UPI003F1A34EF